VDILNKEKGTTFNPILVESFLEIVAPEFTLPHSPEKGEREALDSGTSLNVAGPRTEPCALPG
jgi:hypothetical protein